MVLVKLSLDGHSMKDNIEIENQSQELMQALGKVMSTLPSGSSHNIQLRPDFKVILDDALFLIKPPDARFWMPSAALNDADEIIGDLLKQRKVISEASHADHW